MYLKSIAAQGFKSFADKIELEIKDGITAIVGPNGSGKSNVVDAVKWVLGEQSVKSLRGNNNMTDVIFAGSKSRSPHTRASVALTFDNEDRYLNCDFNEVEVKRIVYKTGENEYFINNSKVRLKDITNLFLDSGTGKESFNIISQGAIVNVINSKPYERRAIFEEAAGVLKYKKRKEESLKKLERTQENLERIKLVIEELRTTVEPLKKQSEVARKYIDYKNELEHIEVALIANDIENFNQKRIIFQRELDLLNNDKATLENSNTEYNLKIEKLKLESLKIEDEISKNNENLIALNNEIASLNSQKQMTSERQKYEIDNVKLQSNIVALKEEVLSLGKNLNVLKKEISILEVNVQKQKDDYSMISLKVNDFSQRIKIENDLYQNKNKEYLTLKNKADILEINIANDIKLPYAIKSILNNPRLTSVHGILGKLIDAEEKHATAIEIALGYNANVVVVDDEKGAKDCINYLKDNKLGRATFFPLNVISSRSIDSATLNIALSVEGFIDVAANLVTYEPKYEAIVKNQLGNVLIVKDMNALTTLGRLINYKYRVVSLDGEILNTGGSLTGGTVKNAGGILNQKFELEECLKEISRYQMDLSDHQKALDKIGQNYDAILVEQQDANRTLIELVEQLNRKKISLADLEDQHQIRQQELMATVNIQNNELDSELEKLLESYYDKIGEREILEKELDVLKQKKYEITDQLNELEKDSKKVSSEYNKLQNMIKDLEVKIIKNDVNLDNLLLDLNEIYSLTFERAKENYILELELDLARSRVIELKKDIKSLGDVNTGAVAEYERLNTRYEFLIKQQQDLDNSIINLLEIIEEMDGIMETKFIETFNIIKDEFSLVFKKLFKGGQGTLSLTNPENILETGIEIIAEPPGKKLSSIALLSGGEKTLTAIALLFAILNVKTVPFCILDEVEAALDEANVDMFGNYLKEKRHNSQFIVITHKKKTMEFADMLYGITMQESGVSKLVSVELVDAL